MYKKTGGALQTIHKWRASSQMGWGGGGKETRQREKTISRSEHELNAKLLGKIAALSRKTLFQRLDSHRTTHWFIIESQDLPHGEFQVQEPPLGSGGGMKARGNVRLAIQLPSSRFIGINEKGRPASSESIRS